jgi:hypothetical protein
MRVDTFRLVGVARQFRSVRPSDAGPLIQHLAFGPDGLRGGYAPGSEMYFLFA